METITIKKLSVSQRLKVIDEIWESLIEDEEGVESPKWHHEVLEERKKLLDSGKAKFITFEELKRRK